MLSRLVHVVAFGLVMMTGTLAVHRFGLQTGTRTRALTLAFTTFVLFQFFNVFNVRVERASCFNRHLFSNPLLWWSLSGVVMLQAVAVHWPPAQAIFHTTGLNAYDWAMCAGVASSVLVLEEGRKLGARLLGYGSFRASARRKR
jgi:Ca2+-transporting ATPase